MNYIGKQYKDKISRIVFNNDSLNDSDNIVLFDKDNNETVDNIIEFKSDSTIKMKKSGFDFQLPNNIGFINNKTLQICDYYKKNVLGKYIII